MWRVWLVFVLVVAACGGNRTGAGDDVTGAARTMRARTVGTLRAADLQSTAIAVLGEDRIAAARADVTGTAFCPECVGLDPSQCPDVCARATITVRVYDTGGGVSAPTPIATVFRPSSDFDVTSLDVVALGPDRIG